MPAGRPSVYKPEHGETLIAYMREGYSMTAAAGKIGVSRQTVYAWAEERPEFSVALNIARAAAAAWWEDRARAIAKGGDGNPAITIFALKNRVANEWRDKVETEHTGSVSVSHNAGELLRRYLDDRSTKSG